MPNTDNEIFPELSTQLGPPQDGGSKNWHQRIRGDEKILTAFGISSGLAFYPHQLSFDGNALGQANSSILRFRIMRTGTLARIFLWVNNVTGTSGTAFYNVLRNGAGLFTGDNRLSISASQISTSKLGLGISVNRGDLITLALETIPAGQFHSAPITIIAEVE